MTSRDHVYSVLLFLLKPNSTGDTKSPASLRSSRQVSSNINLRVSFIYLVPGTRDDIYTRTVHTPYKHIDYICIYEGTRILSVLW